MLDQNSPSYHRRFGGTARLYGQHAVDVFSQLHICVIGVGGVGSWAVEALARTGIGVITMIDMDDICITNTNRQIQALQQNFGRIKIEVMVERVREINPECQVIGIDDFITPDNMSRYLNHQIDYVIDAIDSLSSKAALLAYCRRTKIAIVTVGGAGGKIDPTKIQVVDLAKAIQDPLAAKLRERLKTNFNLTKNSKGKLGIDCVFSSEQPVYPQERGSVCTTKTAPKEMKRMDCSSGLGSSTMVTATFGFVAVSHVIKKLLAKPKYQQNSQ